MDASWLKSYWFKLVVIALLLKAGYMVMHALSGWLGNENAYERRVRWFEDEATMYTTAHLFHRNDIGYYEAIAMKGYEPTHFDHWMTWDEMAMQNQARYAFFPFMPMLVKGVMWVTGLSFVAAGNMLFLFISIGAVLLFYAFCRDFFEDEQQAFWSAVLLLIFPFHYYFSMVYTESVFLLILLTCFWTLKRRIWWGFVLAACALILTRTNGIIMGLPFVLYFIEVHRPFERPFDWKRLWPILVIGIPMFITFVAYCYFLYGKTGEYLAFNKVQELWDKRRVWPWESLYNTGDWRDQWRSHYTVVFMALAIWKARSLPLSLNVLIWINLILPLLAFSNQSMPRYISLIFPFFMVLGVLMAKFRWKYVVAGLLLIGHFYTFYYWIISDPFSY